MANRFTRSLRRLFGLAGTQSADTEEAQQAFAERRQFFRRAAIGAASITGTAGAAKAVVDSMPDPDVGAKYAQTAHQGEKELREREYVVMSDAEKATMLDELIGEQPSAPPPSCADL